MDPRDEREIDQALASLASDKQPEAMPADVASRFDAHLKSLIAEDATVIRSIEDCVLCTGHTCWLHSLLDLLLLSSLLPLPESVAFSYLLLHQLRLLLPALRRCHSRVRELFKQQLLLHELVLIK